MFSNGAPSFVFVATGQSGRPKSGDRRLIRSHCMQGKNRKKPASRAAQIPVPSRNQLSSYEAICEGTCSPAAFRNLLQWSFSVPPPPPSDLSLIKLADNVEGPSQELLYKHFATCRTIFYPIGLCLRKDPSFDTWLQWLSEDAAYLHSVLMGTSALQDYMLQRPPSRMTYIHAGKTIALLNDHLSDRVLSIQDSTIAIILALELAAEVEQDVAAAKAHAMGLRKMVRLRGGLQSFLQNAKLHAKLRRIDIFVALSTGEPLHYLREGVTVTSLLSRIPLPLEVNHGPFRPLKLAGYLTDPELKSICAHLHYFVNVLNAAALKEDLQLPDNEFQNCYCWLQYRLIQVQGRLDSEFNECLRLAMLAFLTTVLQIPGKRILYPDLARRFQESYCGLDFLNLDIQPLSAWLLFVGAASVWDPNDAWLRERWNVAIGDLTWPELHRRLMETLWIGVIHDELGRSVFNALTSSYVPASAASYKLV